MASSMHIHTTSPAIIGTSQTVVGVGIRIWAFDNSKSVVSGWGYESLSMCGHRIHLSWCGYYPIAGVLINTIHSSIFYNFNSILKPSLDYFYNLSIIYGKDNFLSKSFIKTSLEFSFCQIMSFLTLSGFFFSYRCV